MVAGVSLTTGLPQPRQWSLAARAKSSFRWSFSSVIVPTDELAGRDRDAEVLQVVLARAANDDGVAGNLLLLHCGNFTWERARFSRHLLACNPYKRRKQMSFLSIRNPAQARRLFLSRSGLV